MPTWTTSARCTPYLPSGYAAVLTSQGTTLSTLINEASEDVQAELEPFYWTFPAASGTPATPGYIQTVVALLVAHKVHLVLGTANELTLEDNVQAMNMWGLYRGRIERLIPDETTGKAVAVLPRVSITGEAMTFGTSPYDSDQYAFAPSGVTGGFEIIEGSVRVSGYERGTGSADDTDNDFHVYFSDENRAWVLDRNNDLIVDSTTVSYDITYLRRRETVRPDVVSWGRIVRG